MLREAGFSLSANRLTTLKMKHGLGGRLPPPKNMRSVTLIDTQKTQKDKMLNLLR